MKPGGHLSHIANSGSDQGALKKLQESQEGPSASMTFVRPNGAQLQEILELMAAGKVKLEVAKVCGQRGDVYITFRWDKTSTGC